MEPLDPDLPRALATPAAHPEDPGAAEGVETLQTHISHVFLTREKVYKLRKAVRLPFLDFSTRRARDEDCVREVQLNRRLSPDVYLGVAPVRREVGGIRVGAPVEELEPGAAVLEHCVVMRRLPSGRDALSLLQAGTLTRGQLDAVAGVLARFHDTHRLGAPAPWSAAEWRDRMARPLRDCIDVLVGLEAPEADAARLERISQRERLRFEALGSAFERRRQAGRAVDGHGDVHLQHVWFERDDEPLLVDCIEFDAQLRQIDVAAEVAFLAMDLAYRGRGDLAERFLRSYAQESDDFDLYSVVDYHVAYRALVRAKVAALAAVDRAISEDQRRAAHGSARRHLALAEEILSAPGPGSLVLLCGSVGSGKSSLAAAWADAAGGSLVSSDRTRKRLAGLAPTDRSGSDLGQGLYDPLHSDRVYQGLLERAAPVLDSGRVVVLDAAFLEASRRQHVRCWARRRGVSVFLLEARCEASVARERLRRREQQGTDPSDAGPDLLDWSRQQLEAPDEWPAQSRWVVATDAPGWRDEVPGLVQRLFPHGSREGGLASFLHPSETGGSP